MLNKAVDFKGMSSFVTYSGQKGTIMKRILWLWHSDLNRGMMESKSNALPLGDATLLTFFFIRGCREREV